MKINNELRDLIPPLSQEEKTLLTESILKDGCRDSILIWDGTIIDGHNRYDICTANSLHFETLEMEFDNIEEVKLWMIDNQKGRRNLTDGWKFELSQVKKAILLEKGREKQIRKPIESVLSIVDKTNHNTREAIANDLGWSTGKVAMADKVWAKAKPDIKEQIKAGEVSFNQAYQDIKKEERKGIIEKQIEEINSTEIRINGKYDVIVIDPPWNYGRAYDPESSRVANPYPEMDFKQLSELEIPSEENCIMWLWTTQAFIWDAKELMELWGFKYKAMLVWDKQRMGMGHWLRMQTEFCLLGIKGKPIWNMKDVRDIISEPRREHSRKPEVFYDMVKRLPGKRIDYFSREKREGFDTFGNDTNKFTNELE